MKSSYHHGDLRIELLENALVLIKKNGIENFSMRELAKKIKVSHSAPYRHFSNVNILFAALAEQGFELLIQSLEKYTQGRNSSEKLVNCGKGYLAFAMEHPEHLEIMFKKSIYETEMTDSLENVSQKSFSILVNVIQEGIDKKEFIPASARSLALSAWSHVHGFSILVNLGLQKEPELTYFEMYEMIAISLIEGIAL